MWCAMTISGVRGDHVVLARAAALDGVYVQFDPNDEDTPQLGDALELHSETTPSASLRVRARIAWTGYSKDFRGRRVRVARLQLINPEAGETIALRTRLHTVEPLVFAVGLEGSSLGSLESFRWMDVAKEDLLSRLDGANEEAVLVLGPGLTPAEARSLLALVTSRFPNSTSNVLAGLGPQLDVFQDFVDNDSVFYVSRLPMEDGHLCAVVTAAARRQQERLLRVEDLEPGTERLLEFSAQIARQQDVPSLGRVVSNAVRVLLDVQDVECLTYNAATELLCSMEPKAGEARTLSAAAGLTGYAARTAERVELEIAGADPRYDADADNPRGDPNVRLIAEPIVGLHSAVLGVAVAIRPAHGAVFSALDVAVMRRLVRCAAAALAAINSRSREETLLDKALSTRASDMFREEALEHHAGATVKPGELLRTSPRWLRTIPWFISGVLASAVVFASIVRIPRYSTGPAVVRARHKVSALATADGLVSSIDVSPGDRVRRGATIGWFQPSSTMSAPAREELRAPIDGLVGPLLAPAGAHIAAGDPILTVMDEKSGCELIALLPASSTIQIQRDDTLRLRLHGYAGVQISPSIVRVSTAVVGPTEAARYLGLSDGTAITMTVPARIVRASLPTTFPSGDRLYLYQDGMTGDAEVVASRDSLLAIVVPGLKAFLATRARGTP
jgi:hypothetical protein